MSIVGKCLKDGSSMIEKLKYWLTVFDLPSGVIMGLYTLVIIGLSITCFIIKRPIDPTILTAYGMVAGLFAIHKTTVATTSIVTNSSTEQNDSPKQ